MAEFKERYQNIEVVITVGQHFKNQQGVLQEFVDVEMSFYPIDVSKNASSIMTSAIILSGGVRFSDFTKENTLKKATHYLFHDSLKAIDKWITEWDREDYRQVITEYFISKAGLSLKAITINPFQKNSIKSSELESVIFKELRFTESDSLGSCLLILVGNNDEIAYTIPFTRITDDFRSRLKSDENVEVNLSEIKTIYIGNKSPAKENVITIGLGVNALEKSATLCYI